MDYIVKIASGFTGLFDEGAKVFVSWVGGIVPKVLLKNWCCFLINFAPRTLFSTIVSIFATPTDVYAVSAEENIALKVNNIINTKIHIKYIYHFVGSDPVINFSINK